MADLQYNTEIMRQSAKGYVDIAKKLGNIKTDLEKQIEDLKAVYWKSDAGEAFMDMYEDSWAVNVEKYIAVLEEMAKLLERAAADYDSVTVKLKQIPGISI